MPQTLKENVAGFVEEMLLVIERESDFESAFRIAEKLVCYLTANSAGLYRCDHLEDTLVAKIGDGVEVGSEPPLPGIELHVASQIYRSGGHTPLMRSLIHEGRRTAHALLTRPAADSEAADILGLGADQVTTLPLPGLAREHITLLVQQLLRFDEVVLHIHPDDVACAVALRVAKRVRPELRISFVNHADHLFSVGVGIADHLFEVSAYGWMLREKRGSMERSSYIGIPILAGGGMAAAPQLSANGPYILTGGARYKFKPIGGMSLAPAMERLLAASPDMRLVVLGGTDRDWWWKPLIRRFGSRVQLINTMPKEQYRDLLQGASLYVDSYPWIGGTAFPEALMLGRSVAGMLGLAWGYSAADDLRSSDEGQFVESCLALIQLDPAALARQQAVRTTCLEHHDPAKVRSRMDEHLVSGHVVCPPPEQLKHPPVPRIEALWEQTGRSNLPSKQRVNLSRAARRKFHLAHARAMGWFNLASLKLMMYGYLP